MSFILSLIPLSLFLFFLGLLPFALQEPVRASFSWVPGLGIDGSFYLDGWGLLLALLISGIGFFVVLYAGAYLKGHPQIGRFYLYLLAFMGAMLGVVSADNMIFLFVFWELTSITSYFLIGFNHEDDDSRASALQALLVTGTGGLCLLAGFIMLGQISGTYEISETIKQGSQVLNHPLCAPAFILILVGAVTKSAQFPFHFWLPNAMAAPAPVSAYLHSSTMVKAGIYLLGRFFPLFGAMALWQTLVPLIGIMTILTGVFLSFRQNDMKRQLAYMTVTALGILVLQLGIGSPMAIQSAAVFLLAHAFYKGALFMIVGAVDHELHCRDAEKLGALIRKMPITGAAALLAGLSMAGFPPFFGFIAKEMVLESLLHSAWLPAAGFALTAAALSFMVYFLLICVKPFFLREHTEDIHHAHEPSACLWLGAVLLAAAGLVVGVFPGLVAPLLKGAALAVSPGIALSKISLWHGFNTALFWSLGALGAGFFLYRSRFFLRNLAERLNDLLFYGPEEIYRSKIVGLNILAKAQTRFLQNGSLRFYLQATLTAVFLLAAVFLWAVKRPSEFSWSSVGAFELSFCVLAAVGAVAAASTYKRLTAVAYLGVVSLSVTLLFLLFGAPDLAMTQFAVDMLTIILLALVLTRMPVAVKVPFNSTVNAAISILGGFVMFLFVLHTGTDAKPLSAVSQFFAENSLSIAHGRNIVNVILVDFRAFDTLGEITVLMMAGIGAYSLLRLISSKRKARS